MKTAYLLMAQYDAMAVIPVARVVEDYFSHLSVENFLRKVAMGDITIPLVRIDPSSQKGAKGVHLADLADYLNVRHAAAVKELRQLTSNTA